ncbi:hypothetical protein [Amycolatopsis benzoatilytica]|uniref:hypothetical protein n=1 Tax=Amycolatopsis benzoatilytica TaxID=346045 RepID=UPI00038127C0|nr:hypothetical protein [Amycolatopsis benzoatilytica]
MRSDRRTIGWLLAALSATVLVLSAWQLTGAARLYLDTAFILLAPGWAVVAHLRLATQSLEWLVAIAVGLSGTLLLAELMTALHWWHPWEAFAVLAGATLFELLRQLTAPRRAGSSR